LRLEATAAQGYPRTPCHSLRSAAIPCVSRGNYIVKPFNAQTLKAKIESVFAYNGERSPA
jgi:hypothetical protein